MLYFSFGSNMSEKRLLQRILALRIGVAVLTGHRLCFRKSCELDGSAKCDILETENAGDLVFGVVYSIEESQKPILDGYEGLGFGYSIKMVSVKSDEKFLEAFTYYATSINPSLKPYYWYKRHVLEGARENRMPEGYIRSIEAVEAILDPDTERRNRELSIYR